MFDSCNIPENLKLSAFLINLGINVSRLSLKDVTTLRGCNLAGLENLSHLSIAGKTQLKLDVDLLQNLTNFSFSNKFEYFTK